MRRLTQCKFAAVAAVLILGTCESFAQAPANSSGPVSDSLGDKVIWTSTSSNSADFARELSDLYLTLYNAGRLSLKANVVAHSDSIEKVLRDNGNLIGPEYPLVIDSLACDLNANRCERERTRSAVDQKLQQDLPKTLAGFAPSPATWRLKPGDVLVLPAIRLTPISKWVQVQVTGDAQISTLVTKVLGGCTTYDAACQQDILKYNRKLDEGVFAKESHGFSGTLSLPVVAARATVDISSAQETQTVAPPVRAERPDQTLELAPSSDGSFKVKNFGVRTDVPVDFTSKSRVIEDLRSNTLGGASRSTKFQSTLISTLLGDDFSNQQKAITKLIAFPYAQLSDYPSLVKGATVGIFDSWIDGTHCAFESGRFKVHNLSNASTPPGVSLGHCDEQTATGELDHGTHVAGVIGGKLPAGNNFGLNPYATVVAYEVDFSKLSDPAELSTLASNLAKMPEANAEVVNLSFGYMLDPQRGIQDPVQTSIASQQDRTLFVMAAGNYGTDISYICDVRPTCFDLPNVIVVAALDRSDPPKLYTAANGKLQTNYGSRVHIGAIGEDVFSTVAFGRYGTMSGTSFAAPQVAAVASLMMRKYRKITPQEVKNRLIYCSDYVPTLGDKLFGGRLDASCALDGDAGSLLLSTANDPVRGYLQAGSTVRFRDRESGRIVQIPVESVRALHFDSNRQVFTAYFNAEKSSDSRLLRETNLVPEPPTELISFISNGTPKSINVSDITRFTSGVKK